MNDLTSIDSIVGGVMAIMVTVVSHRVLRDSVLGNPLLSVCVGLLSYIGLLFLPDELKEAVILVYAVLSLALCLLILWLAFKWVRHSRLLSNLSKMIKNQSYRSRDQENPGNELTSRRNRP